MKTLFIAAILVAIQASAIVTPFKMKSHKPLTYNGDMVRAQQLLSLLNSVRPKMGKLTLNPDWEGVYDLKVTPDQGYGEPYMTKIPVLSSPSFPGSPAKSRPELLLQMPAGIVAEGMTFASTTVPYIITEGKGHAGFDLYMGVEDFGFFYYRLAVKPDRTGEVYWVETLSGEPREQKVATLALQGFTSKAALNLQVYTYDFTLANQKSLMKTNECGGSFKGEMAWVKFPENVAIYPGAYAWQNVATDGADCVFSFGGTPIGERNGVWRSENPGYALGFTKDCKEGELCLGSMQFGLASEILFQGEPGKTNLVMKVYFTKVYQVESTLSVSLTAR